MGANGFLYLSWFLSPANPDRIGYWFMIYFIIFPFLALLGLISLLRKDALRIPIGIGVALLLYVGVLTIAANSYQLGLSWLWTGLPEFSFVLLHLALFVMTLGWLVVSWRQ